MTRTVNNTTGKLRNLQIIYKYVVPIYKALGLYHQYQNIYTFEMLSYSNNVLFMWSFKPDVSRFSTSPPVCPPPLFTPTGPGIPHPPSPQSLTLLLLLPHMLSPSQEPEALAFPQRRAGTLLSWGLRWDDVGLRCLMGSFRTTVVSSPTSHSPSCTAYFPRKLEVESLTTSHCSPVLIGDSTSCWLTAE